MWYGYWSGGFEPIAEQHPGGVLLPPVQTLVDTFIFASGENANRIRPLPPKTCDSQTANSYATGSFKPPLPKGGGFASGKTGGIPQAGRVPHRFVLLRKPPL